MKWSLRSATAFLSGSFRLLYRFASCGRGVSILLFPAILLLPLTAEAGLPQLAISIPTDQNLAAGLKAEEQCDVPGKLMVLPPQSFDFAGGEVSASPSEEQAVQSMPEGSEVWLDVVVDAGSLSGKESEKEITERVDALVRSMPLSAAAVRGLVVEIREPLQDPNLFAFGLVRLALAAKGSNAGLRLAFVFSPGFVGRHGDIVKRLATYSDLLGISYAEGWQEDAAWIAEQALNKPVILKLATATSAASSQFLAAMLAASGTSVEIVWAEPPDAKDAAALCATSSFLSRHITSNMFSADSAISPFSVAVEGVANNKHRWFSGAPSDVVIVARVNASRDSPKTVRLESDKPGPFEINWYDPATGARTSAEPSDSNED